MYLEVYNGFNTFQKLVILKGELYQIIWVIPLFKKISCSKKHNLILELQFACVALKTTLQKKYN